MSKRFLPRAEAAVRANETFKQRIAKAGAALGEQRSEAIVAGLKENADGKRGTLKEICTALEVALPRAITTITFAKTAPGGRRESSVLELAPITEERGGQYSARRAAALIRFYVSDCEAAEDRAAFAAKFIGQFDAKEFIDLAIVAAIRAGEPATKLDVRIFEARAAKEAPPHRVHIPRSRH